MVVQLDSTLGQGVLAARKQLRMNQRTLAHLAHVSPSVLSELENGEAKSIGGHALYRLASVLGLRMETILGLPLLNPETVQESMRVPERESLEAAVREHRWPPEDVAMLEHVHFRGRRPTRPLEWWYIYESIRRSINW